MTARKSNNGRALRLMALLLALTVGVPLLAKKKQKVKAVQPVVAVQLSDNDAKRFNYFYLEAVRQQQAGHFAAAYDLFSHCLDIHPTSAATYYALSAYYSEMHDDDAMLAYMEKAAELSPDNDTYLERLGQVYIKTHDYAKATEVYERIADSSPGRTDVLGILLQLYQADNAYDKVIAIVKSETDNEKRFALMHKAEDLLMQTGAICPIYYYTDLYMVDKGLEGFFSTPLGGKYFHYSTFNA